MRHNLSVVGMLDAKTTLRWLCEVGSRYLSNTRGIRPHIAGVLFFPVLVLYFGCWKLEIVGSRYLWNMLALESVVMDMDSWLVEDGAHGVEPHVVAVIFFPWFFCVLLFHNGYWKQVLLEHFAT